MTWSFSELTRLKILYEKKIPWKISHQKVKLPNSVQMKKYTEQNLVELAHFHNYK